jgi:hypothetical protein
MNRNNYIEKNMAAQVNLFEGEQNVTYLKKDLSRAFEEV